MDREDREADYEKKKFQQGKHKKIKEGFSEQEEYLIKKIQSMDAEALFHFLQEKYDKITEKNDKLLYPINKALTKRLPELPKQLKDYHNQKIMSFARKHTNRDFKQNELKRVTSMFYGIINIDTVPKITARCQHDQVLGTILSLSTNTETPHVIIEHFYNGQKEKDIFYEPSFKRVKKECLEMLANFIELEKKTKEVKYNPN